MTEAKQKQKKNVEKSRKISGIIREFGDFLGHHRRGRKTMSYDALMTMFIDDVSKRIPNRQHRVEVAGAIREFGRFIGKNYDKRKRKTYTEYADEFIGINRGVKLYSCPVCGRLFRSRHWLENGHLRECMRRHSPAQYRVGEVLTGRSDGRNHPVSARMIVTRHNDDKVSAEWKYVIDGNDKCIPEIQIERDYRHLK